MSEQEENVESEKLAEDIRQIKEMGSVTLPDAKHVIHCLNIIGQVRGIIFCLHKTRPPSMSISYLPLLLSSRIGASRGL